MVLSDSPQANATYQDLHSRLETPVLQTVRIFSPSGGYISGAGPELGNWDPHKAIPVPKEGAIVEVPQGAILSFKRLSKDDAQIQWEPGSNRVHWVSADDITHTIHLDP